jgi:ADP-ribose pyrophosphatase YjhB (NUDIX family)
MDELTDPETLREREDVEFIDAPPEEHQNHFEMYEPVEGTVIEGVADENDRLLLLEHEQAETPALSHTKVEHGNDWVTAARRIVEEGTGVEATIDEPLRVRHHTYRSETGDETAGYDVVFAASLDGDGEISPDAGHDWTAAWRDTVTLDLPDDEDNDVLNDIRLFVE